MGEKVPKKMNLKEIGIEKIILIAIAGIVLLLANFSEWKNAISEKTEKNKTEFNSFTFKSLPPGLKNIIRLTG